VVINKRGFRGMRLMRLLSKGPKRAVLGSGLCLEMAEGETAVAPKENLVATGTAANERA
jgi:hypothetical protein